MAPNGQLLAQNAALLSFSGDTSTQSPPQHIGEIIGAEAFHRIRDAWKTTGAVPSFLAEIEGAAPGARRVRITTDTLVLGDAEVLLIMVADVSAGEGEPAASNHVPDIYRSLVENTSAGLIRWDERLRHLYVNQAAAELLERAPTELLGRAPRQAKLSEELCDFWEEQVRAVFSRGVSVSEIFTHRREGQTTAVRWRFVPEWDSKEQVASVLATAQEITQETQAQEELARESAALAEKFAARTSELQMANAELARAAQLKDEFLANMSHELRTPLTVVLTFTEILKGGLYGSLDPRQQKPLEAIEESGKHLLSLITDILDVSKIEAGRLELELSNVDVESVCQSSLQLVLPQAKKKELSAQINIDPNVSQIRADERRLKQILVNLLGNAVKFTPFGGAIGLEVVGDPETQAVHFVVWDTGIGIAKEDMGRLFQPFVQLDSSLTRQFEGTGLGLALVRRLTELHNGTIAVESQVGEGSRFTVSLPWIEATVEPEPEAALEEEANSVIEITPSQGRILLVEDNQAAVRPVQKFLSAQGYEVIEARDGAEAIRRAIEEQPDVILMDIQMPVMDGFEATRRIRSNRQTAEIPIIALTALAMPGDYERCMQAGASAYISKPLRLRDLSDTIEAQLNPESSSEA